MSSGFRNLGNTCFVSSVLQCVFHTPALCDAFQKCKNGDHGHTDGRACLVCSMQQMMTKCLANGPPVSPDSLCSQLTCMKCEERRHHCFKHAIIITLGAIIPNYQHGEQQDAGEFLNGLIWKIHDLLLPSQRLVQLHVGDVWTLDNVYLYDLHRQINPLDECTSIVTEVTVKCNSCHTTSVTEEQSYLLQLTIQGDSITESLCKYNSSENLTGENQYFCLRCQKLTDAQRLQRIAVTSKVLIIALSRWNNSLKKIDDKVKYPEVLELYIEQKCKKYQIKGFLCHQGYSMNAGHYIAFASKRKQWYYMSDEKVIMTSTRQAMQQQAFIIIYEQCSEPDTTPSVSPHNQVPWKCTTDSSTKSSMNLQLKHTQLNSARRKEETLLRCIAEGDRSTALKTAQELGCVVKPQVEVSEHAIKSHPSAYEQLIKSSADILGGRDLTEILVNFTFPQTEQNVKKIFTLNRRSMQCLQQCPDNGDNIGCWLNDEVINGYCGLIARSKNNLKDGHSVYPMNSLITSKLWSAQVMEAMMTYYKRDHLFDFSYWIVPVHLGVHWAIMVVDFTQKVLWYSDSMDCRSGLHPLGKIIHYIDARHSLECKRPFIWEKWRIKLCLDYPLQQNNYDCGVFAIKAAQSIVFGRQPQYSQKDTVRFRSEIMKELISGELQWSCCTSAKAYPSAHQFPIQDHIKKEQVHVRSDPDDQTSNLMQVSNDPVSFSCDVVDQAVEMVKQVSNDTKGVLIGDSAAPTEISMETDRSIAFDSSHESLSQRMKVTIAHPTMPSPPLEHGNKVKGASPSSLSFAKSLKKPLRCSVCNKQYKTHAGLYKHRRAKHPCTINSTAPISCKESNCDFKCQNLKQLRCHLHEEHNMPMETIMMDFNDAKDFEQWKAQYEIETNASFVRTTGQKSACDRICTYYYCNRSGYFNTSGQNMRSLKSQGTSKLNAYCTAAIVVTQSDQDRHKIQANIYTTHYGHSITLGHIRLPKEHRYTIAAKISQGVSFERILDDIRESIGGHVSRLHLTTRKDIINIERAFGLRTAQKHKDDATSVALWVQEMGDCEANPVLLYKPQDQDTSPDCPSLKREDFMLALQTPMQEEMLITFGKNIICMDDTHGTNSYDFSLITVMVVDEFGEGCPVAWCLCNRTDKYILIDFLMAIRKNVGHIRPCWVMTDDAEQYYSAWVAVFGLGPHKLLCTWHVDRAWRGAVNATKDKETAALVYYNIRVLMEESDANNFNTMLHKTMARDSQATVCFAKYFNTHYVKRVEEWVACYRKAANINTNMYVEGFHRILKYVYIKGSINK